jgi:hypothetical protein
MGTVLIVEDDLTTRAALAELLGRDGPRDRDRGRWAGGAPAAGGYSTAKLDSAGSLRCPGWTIGISAASTPRSIHETRRLLRRHCHDFDFHSRSSTSLSVSVESSTRARTRGSFRIISATGTFSTALGTLPPIRQGSRNYGARV